MCAGRLGTRYGWVALLWVSSRSREARSSSPRHRGHLPCRRRTRLRRRPRPSPLSREALLEERLRKLEAMNQTILQQYEAMERKQNQRYEKLSQEFKALQERLKLSPPVSRARVTRPAMATVAVPWRGAVPLGPAGPREP